MARGSGTWAAYGGGYTPQAVAGGAPAWVPANAKIHIDFLGGTPQGRAWVDGTGEVAVETLLGNDPVVDGGYATTQYSSSDLTSNGYKPSGSATLFTAFIGAARTKIAAGATFRFVTKNPMVNVTGTITLALVSADGNDAIECSKGGVGIHVESWNGSLNANSGTVFSDGFGAVNVCALTVVDMRFEGAGNGSSALLVATLDENDRPPDNPLVGFAFNYRSTNAQTIQSITLYDPLSSTAGLSELSEVT